MGDDKTDVVEEGAIRDESAGYIGVYAGDEYKPAMVEVE